MKKRLVLIGSVVLIVAIVVLAWKFSSSPHPAQATQGGRSTGAPRTELRIPVRGQVVTPRVVDNKIFATGNVLATEEVELRSEVSGKVVEIRFKEGSHVKKGDLLVKINDSELQAQLQKALSRRKFIEEKEARQRRLREINAISQEQYDEVRNELTAINAEVELLNAQIQKTEVRAPFNGVVGLRFISEGSYITPATLIARMQDLSSVKIDFSIPEKYATLVGKGSKVRFSVEGSSRQHEGTVYAIEPKIDPVTRTLRLRAIAPNDKEAILPGSFTKVDLILKRDLGAILAPTHAIVPDIDGQKVFVSRNGLATQVSVETGIRTEGYVHVLKGLSVNDTLITTGILQLRPGLPVTVTIDN